MGRPKSTDPRHERVYTSLTQTEVSLLDGQVRAAAERGETVSRSEFLRRALLQSVRGEGQKP